ncbi:hypothetical protein L1049_006945 [Liquidambar formosana]|uniref:Uncharacterized protein n=1 Tax=Liquidambar formosana TaxID=63359 RepID=A0AAP0WRM7_LIQFO
MALTCNILGHILRSKTENYPKPNQKPQPTMLLLLVYLESFLMFEAEGYVKQYFLLNPARNLRRDFFFLQATVAGGGRLRSVTYLSCDRPGPSLTWAAPVMVYGVWGLGDLDDFSSPAGERKEKGFVSEIKKKKKAPCVGGGKREWWVLTLKEQNGPFR